MKLEQRLRAVQERGGAFALYRAAGSEQYTFLAQYTSPQSWDKDDEEGEGFVVAPFQVSDDAPALLIRSEIEEQLPLPAAPHYRCLARADLEEGRSAYHQSFIALHRQLLAKSMRKVVLARRQSVELKEQPSLQALFETACVQNPTSFVALWWTPASGLWLVATPELLLSRRGNDYRTMALAGTMPTSASESFSLGGWSEKNRREQKEVADFITSTLSEVSCSLEQTPPHPIKVGDLVHLRTDFSFQSDASLFTIVRQLHPTPAVCGSPRAAALRAIAETEPVPRGYYSGFCGSVTREKADLFVALRCMHIVPAAAYLYAGGGILPESTEEEEWQETCRKMRPMLSLFTLF